MLWNKKEPTETPIELMPFDQLLYTRQRLDNEIATRGTAELDALKEKLILIANAQGLSLIDLFSGKPAKKEKKKREVRAKYRDPETGETWSGMGRPKKWLQEKLDAGRSIDEFAVN